MKLMFATVLWMVGLFLIEDYPAPKQTENRLFYLQRSTNTNTVIYDAQLNGGHYNTNTPIDAYWLMYARNGEREELNFFEQQRAYGIKYEKVEQGTIQFYLKAYPKRKIKAVINNGQPQAFMVINQQLARLNKVFIQTRDNQGMFPAVKHIDLFGTNIKTNTPVFERIAL